VSDKQAI